MGLDITRKIFNIQDEDLLEIAHEIIKKAILTLKKKLKNLRKKDKVLNSKIKFEKQKL